MDYHSYMKPLKGGSPFVAEHHGMMRADPAVAGEGAGIMINK